MAKTIFLYGNSIFNMYLYSERDFIYAQDLVMFLLYDYYRSTACYRVRIALNLKQIEYKKQQVHLINGGGEQHSESYVKINPFHLVPTLVSSGQDLQLTQSMVIIDYLEQLYPKPFLYPTDPVQRGDALSIAMAICCDVHPLNNLRVLAYLKEELSISEEQKMDWYFHWLKLGFDGIEAMLEKKQLDSSPFCIGNQFSIADCCLIPQVYNANRFGFDISSYPKIQAVNTHCIQLPWVQCASPE